jgi:hypothetical protein
MAGFWVSVGSFGCLADPPTFAPRGQIPPFIIAGQVEPPLGSIYQGPTSFDVNVPFRSEDVNTDLDARLYLDLLPGSSAPSPTALRGAVSVPAGNYEEVRWANLENVLVPERECHSLTLIMTYVDNIDLYRGGLPSDDTRAARAVWWLNIGDDGETKMAECPRASQVDSDPSGG